MVEAEHGTPTWKFTQCFGDKGDVEDITEADIISTVEFDHTGNYLATGDKGGRVVLFERNETVSASTPRPITLFGLMDG
jgi:serine/threonine-protein phosphatase 2A regulatory subunit B